MNLDKIRSCMWKLVVGFRSYGLIRLLGPSGSNVVSSPQTPKSRNFLRWFNDHGFNGFIFWFCKKWAPVCENWSYGSGLTTWSIYCQRLLGPDCPKLVLDHIPQIYLVLISKYFFMSSSVKRFMKQAFIFKF